MNIVILGASGLVGSAVTKQLHKSNESNILTPSSKELNLLDFKATLSYFKDNKIDQVYLCAAKVGGLLRIKLTQ